MKKFLVLMVMSFAMILPAIESTAQRAVTMPTVAGDTVVTSTSLDTVFKTITVSAGYSALGIQVQGIKVSGTVTSKAYLYGSLNGVTYTLTDSSAAFANAAGIQSAFFTKTGGLPFVFYRVHVRPPTSAGTTESLAVRVFYVLRKYD